MSLRAPKALYTLSERCLAHGGRAYLVGGGVRDHLMGIPVKDFDVEVYGLDMDALGRLLRKLGHVNAVGKSFGVYKWRPRGAPELGEVDVSIPRRDSNQGPGHKGIAVQGDPNMSLQEAARRRDLTINAMMWDLHEDTLVDVYNGQADLMARRLQAVDEETFLEDPLRALRAVQFAARLGFEPTEALMALCRRAPLDELPAERIQGEWAKLLLRGKTPSRGLSFARHAQILERVFPEVADLDNDALVDALVPRRADLEPEGRAWALMLLGWLDGAPADAVIATLDRLWLHKWGGYPLRDRLLRAVGARDLPAVDLSSVLKLAAEAEAGLVLAVRHARDRDPQSLAMLELATQQGVNQRKPEPLLQGRHLGPLGVRPGPGMGELLRAAYSAQLDLVFDTEAGAIAWAKARLDNP